MQLFSMMYQAVLLIYKPLRKVIKEDGRATIDARSVLIYTLCDEVASQKPIDTDALVSSSVFVHIRSNQVNAP